MLHSLPAPASLLGRLAVLILVAAAGVGCSRPAPLAPPIPASVSFHPCAAGSPLWLATSVAVEVKTERDARLLEAEGPLYVGEIMIRGGRVLPAQVALSAAEQGATHFRLVSNGDELHLDVVLYRLDRARWSSLPEALRPAPPVGPLMPDAPHASL